MNAISDIDTSKIPNKESLEAIIQEYTRISDFIQYKFLKNINITKYSKAWWTEEYSNKLSKYRSSKTIEDWRNFKRVIKKTKYIFFDNKIQEITLKNKRP